jgi:hypothetical protein
VAGESNRLFYYHDIDKRAGYYVGLTGRYQDALEVRLLHYDNRANPNAENDSIDTYAWHTNFYSAGVRYTPQASWTFISQWMRGFTSVEDDDGISLDTWQFHAAFALASWQHGANRLSARYDRFTTSEPEYGGQDGHAWTFAYIYQFNERWNVALEALNIYTVNAARVLVDEPLAASERELQLAVRLEL